MKKMVLIGFILCMSTGLSALSNLQGLKNYDGSPICVYKRIFNALDYGKQLAANYQWRSADNSRQVLKNINEISPKEVFLLVNEMIGSEMLFGKYTNIEKCDFKDLDSDGFSEILAPLEGGCTACPTTLLIIKKNTDHFLLFYIKTMYGSIGDFCDLDGDGKLEIISRTQRPGYTTNEHAVYTSTVLSMRNGAIQDISDEFPERYENHKKALLTEIREMDAELVKLRTTGGDANWSNQHLSLIIKDLETAIQEHKQALAEVEVKINRTVSPKSVQ